MKSCAFFARTLAEVESDLLPDLKEAIRLLVRYEGVDTFIFSNLNSLELLAYPIAFDEQSLRSYINLIGYDMSLQLRHHRLDDASGIDRLYTRWSRNIFGFKYNYARRFSAILNSPDSYRLQYMKEVIDSCSVCLFYFEENYPYEAKKLPKPKLERDADLYLALEYAKAQGKRIISLV